MKIFKINSSDNNSGGASRVAMDIFQQLKTNGHEVDMFVGNKTSSTTAVKKIYKSRLSSLISHLFSDDFSYFNTSRLLKVKAFIDAQVVHAHNVHGWYFNLQTLTKMSQTKPLVWTLHDMWSITPHCAHSYDNICSNGFFTCRNKSDYPSLWWHNEESLMKKKRDLYKDMNVHLVTPSHWLANKVNQSVLKDKPITVIPNGVDTNIFCVTPQTKAREAVNLRTTKKVILFIASGGLANEFKGGTHIKSIAKQYENNSNILFLCVGGDEDVQVNNLCLRKSTSDKLTLANYYSAADVLIFPSLAENFPLVILEALACGLPIVSFDVGGVNEAITHKKTGYITPRNTTKELIQGLEYVLKLEQYELETLVTQCRQHAVLEYSITKMTQRYVSLYKSLV
jgi:glycosyltransferase involved in cell wall biosynthesis